jgi:hypothetical protein
MSGKQQLVVKEGSLFLFFVDKHENNGVDMKLFIKEYKLHDNKNRVIHLTRHLLSKYKYQLCKYQELFYIKGGFYTFSSPEFSKIFSTGRGKSLVIPQEFVDILQKLKLRKHDDFLDLYIKKKSDELLYPFFDWILPLTRRDVKNIIHQLNDL